LFIIKPLFKNNYLRKLFFLVFEFILEKSRDEKINKVKIHKKNRKVL